jgi:CRP/FNR family cyclic AMP-dependent transcriptional regulator
VTMTTVERVVALHRVGIFADVPGRTLAALAQRASEVEVPAGALVIAEGAVEEHLFAVVRGRVRVHRAERTVTVLGPGATVGELAALVPEPRSASVMALEPTTLLRIDRPLLEELLADRPALANGIIAALVAMLRERARSEADTTTA